jgi:hypothetical protein
LVYVLERVTEDEKSCTEGVAFLESFEGVGMANYSMSDIKAISGTIQGTFPLRLRVFMLCKTPAVFSTMMKLAKPLLTRDTSEKLKVLNSSESIADMMAGETPQERLSCLPSDLGGDLNVEESMDMWIKYRYTVENIDYHQPYPSRDEIANGATQQ